MKVQARTNTRLQEKKSRQRFNIKISTEEIMLSLKELLPSFCSQQGVEERAFLGVCTCHFIVFVVSLLCCVQQFCNPKDCSPPGSSVPGISQARVLERVPISFSAIFPAQGLNLHLLHWQVDSLPLSHRKVHLSHYKTLTTYAIYE